MSWDSDGKLHFDTLASGSATSSPSLGSVRPGSAPTLGATFLGRVAYQQWRMFQPFPEWAPHWELLDNITKQEWIVIAMAVVGKFQEFNPVLVGRSQGILADESTEAKTK